MKKGNKASHNENCQIKQPRRKDGTINVASFKARAPYQVMSRSQRAGSKSKEVAEQMAEEKAYLIRINQTNPNRSLASSQIQGQPQKSANDDLEVKKKLLESYRKLYTANQLRCGEKSSLEAAIELPIWEAWGTEMTKELRYRSREFVVDKI